MLDKIDVINAYRFILGREAENDEVIECHLRNHKDIAALRKSFLHSSEFQKTFPTQSSIHEFSGITPEDVELLKRYVKSNNASELGYLTDFMGIRHSVKDLPHINDRDGSVITEIPIPNDTFHSDAIEYVGVFMAVEDADDTFTMFELGAGWGPWMSICGMACKTRGGFQSIDIIGVEGEANKIPYIQRHLKKNSLMPECAELESFHDLVHAMIYHGVVNTDGLSMKFPLVSGEHYGASLITDTSSYRNATFIEVPGYSPRFLFKNYDTVDIAHIDIQGYEGILFENEETVGVFKEKVKYICLGTHSRKIEGYLLEQLYNSGFILLREKPCHMALPKTKPESFIDITTIDGTQIWRNLSL
jgi:hypothetical protein